MSAAVRRRGLAGAAATAAACAALIAGPMWRPAAAQAVSPLLGTRGESISGVTHSPPRAWMAADPAGWSREVASRRSIAASASIVGGAVVGAWLGYFVSQVVKSDWEGMRTAERAGHRRRFAFSGAAAGAIAGYLLRPRARPGSVPRRAPMYMYIPRSTRDYITRAELQRAVVLSALEAIQALRPEWLAVEQPGGMPGTSEPTTPDGAGVVVYAADTRLGGWEVLAELSIPEVEELRLYDASETQRRWGVAHPHGAIEVVPAAGGPRR